MHSPTARALINLDILVRTLKHLIPRRCVITITYFSTILYKHNIDNNIIEGFNDNNHFNGIGYILAGTVSAFLSPALCLAFTFTILLSSSGNTAAK